MFDSVLLILSLFLWMPFPLGLFAAGVFSLLGLIFAFKVLAFFKKVIPFF